MSQIITPYKRIVVVGASNTGKSTLVQGLAQALGYDISHIKFGPVAKKYVGHIDFEKMSEVEAFLIAQKAINDRIVYEQKPCFISEGGSIYDLAQVKAHADMRGHKGSHFEGVEKMCTEHANSYDFAIYLHPGFITPSQDSPASSMIESVDANVAEILKGLSCPVLEFKKGSRNTRLEMTLYNMASR